jgi:hypothetical protein
MENFPKKYTPKDLRKRFKLDKQKYSGKNSKKNVVFSMNDLLSSRKISYQDFFLIYLKDFFNKRSFIQATQKNYPNEMDDEYKQLFLIYGDQLENVFSTYLFFSKKNQTLSQV